MIKKITVSVSILALAATFPFSAFAQNVEPIARPIPYPWPPVRIINVTPGHPLELNSCGKLVVNGRGWARIENFNGSVGISVKGKLAVKKEDLGSVNISGFNRKHERGSYVVYSGRGTASGNGQDLDLVVFGKAKVQSKGCGSTNLKGHWEGTYQRFWVIYPEPKPIPLPLPIELTEFEAQALAE